MTIQEIVSLLPQGAEVMAAYGLHCFSCSVGGVEALQEGCRMHGFDDETIDALVEDLNDAVRSQPVRPQTLNVTDAAAERIAHIATGEGRMGDALTVLFDEAGNFCMEFTPLDQVKDELFRSPGHPEIRVTASPLTLWRIGGASIDFRDGQFKLDLPEDGQGGCCGGDKSKCGCGNKNED